MIADWTVSWRRFAFLIQREVDEIDKDGLSNAFSRPEHYVGRREVTVRKAERVTIIARHGSKEGAAKSNQDDQR